MEGAGRSHHASVHALMHPCAPCMVPQEGYRADLLLVDGNPLEDISVLAQPSERLKLILLGGRVVRNAL